MFRQFWQWWHRESRRERLKQVREWRLRLFEVRAAKQKCLHQIAEDREMLKSPHITPAQKARLLQLITELEDGLYSLAKTRTLWWQMINDK